MGLEIGICGGGVGGLTAAIALAKDGHAVTVHEQARAFARIGADVNLTPNAVHALDRLGVGETLRETAARPRFRISRTWDSGEETDFAHTREGAPWGSADRLYEVNLGGLDYVLAVNHPEGYASLNRRPLAVAS